MATTEDLEARIDILEQDVEALTEPLRSVLQWQVGGNNRTVRVSPQPDGLHIAGQSDTKAILDRLL